MPTRLENIGNSWQAPTEGTFQRYIKPAERFPEIDPNKLHLQFLLGDGRSSFNLLTTGDASLLLLYRSRKGYVSSVKETGEELEILQFQGSKQEGYRVTQGFRVAQFMADQIREIALDPAADFRRITMMNPDILVENMSSVQSPFAIMRIPEVKKRYYGIIAHLGMEYSEEEGKFIVETANLPG